MFEYARLLIPIDRLIRFLTILLVAAYASSSYAENIEVRYFQTDARYSYRIDLLRLALQRTLSSHEQLVLTPLAQEVTQKRGSALLEQGEADVAFSPAPRKESINSYL